LTGLTGCTGFSKSLLGYPVDPVNPVKCLSYSKALETTNKSIKLRTSWTGLTGFTGYLLKTFCVFILLIL